ncbi:hypothetical protein VM98_34755, partial [Streptomyces rubellomurinus subsp. indigoferus]
AQLAAPIGGSAKPLTAVVHAARVLDDGTVESLSPEQVARALRPQPQAPWHPHEFNAGPDLSPFVLFASLAALMDSPGQVDYAAATAAPAALPASRRAAAAPATSPAWHPSSETPGRAAQPV